jgi:hypothetical protein
LQVRVRDWSIELLFDEAAVLSVAPRRVAGLRSVSRTQVAPSRHPSLRSVVVGCETIHLTDGWWRGGADGALVKEPAELAAALPGGGQLPGENHKAGSRCHVRAD